jgi:hypothetical protein
VLLEQAVSIEASNASLPMQYVIGAAVAGVVLILLVVLLAYQIRVHKEQAKRFLSSFIKSEGLLAMKVCWDLWVTTAAARALDHAHMDDSTCVFCLCAGHRR